VFLGIVGATLGILIATMLMLYVRQRKGAFPRLVDAAAKAPSAVSHTVLGLAMVIALTGFPFYLAGTLTILLIAYLVIYMPQAAISTGSGIDQVGGELLEASSVAGASQSRTFFRITLPLMRPALAAGWALLFVMMVGDLTAVGIARHQRQSCRGVRHLRHFQQCYLCLACSHRVRRRNDLVRGRLRSPCLLPERSRWTGLAVTLPTKG
jgi:iron(III) transport system permease protein